MPYLAIHTTEQISDKEKLLDTASRRVSELLGKPESYVMVELHDNRAMRFAGSNAPLAYLQLKSLGLQEQQTEALSAGLCALIEEQLGISGDRIYIEFSAPPRAFWGWNRSTFA